MTLKSVVLLGGEGCGKTSLALRFVLNTYSEAYDPHVSDKYKKEEVVNGEVIVFEISDVCGCPEFRELVMQECERADGLLFVIDATDDNSIDEVKVLRREALQVSDKPSVLVASKCDSDDVIDNVVEGSRKLAAEWQVPLVECSSKLSFGVSEAFHQLARTISRFEAASDGEDEEEAYSPSAPRDLVPSTIGLISPTLASADPSPQSSSKVAFSSPVAVTGGIDLLETTTDSGTEVSENFASSTNTKVRKKKKKKKSEEKVVFSETSPLFSLGGLLSMKAFRGNKKYTLPQASGIMEEPDRQGSLGTEMSEPPPSEPINKPLVPNNIIKPGSVSPPVIDIFHQVDMLADLLGEKKNSPDSDTVPALLQPRSPELREGSVLQNQLTPREEGILLTADKPRSMSQLMNEAPPLSPTGISSNIYSSRTLGTISRSPLSKPTTPSLQPGGEHLLSTSVTHFSSSEAVGRDEALLQPLLPNGKFEKKKKKPRPISKALGLRPLALGPAAELPPSTTDPKSATSTQGKWSGKSSSAGAKDVKKVIPAKSSSSTQQRRGCLLSCCFNSRSVSV
eukprot:TRINITY_DN3782_c6_g1_i1.p1 TRINITY_DN3782_c6_g1~~TRINITY_DN3782_c6_g1_i1.p1  ORF type:complete len:566 (+),score=98.94 TRINITY_DN3782_c6_g1_i1:86-1783(+)